MHTIQRNLANTQSKNQVKPLQPDKDCAAKETCSSIEKPIYYACSTKHSLKGWQGNKHNNNTNIVIKLMKGQGTHTHSSQGAHTHSPVNASKYTVTRLIVNIIHISIIYY